MDRSEGIAIIQNMIASMVGQPAQFNFHVNVNVQSTGMVASNTGGVGFMSNPTIQGGHVGSVVGFSVSGGNPTANVEFGRRAATTKIDEKINEALAIMRDIVAEFEKNEPNKQGLKGLAKKLADSAIPPVVSTTVALILNAIFGI